MIRVQVAPWLIEKYLETGHITKNLVEVLDGLPHGAKLADVRYDKGMVSLYFTEIARLPDRDIEIKMRTLNWN